MLRNLVFALTVVGLCWCPAFGQAHHFTIDLKVQTPQTSKTAQADLAAIGVKPKTRDVLVVKSGVPITVKWTLKHTDSKVQAKNILVHFFVAPEEKIGQLFAPKLDNKVVAESALTMDFEPGDQTEGTLVFSIPRPGAYLLRLETIGASVGPDGHEHFAALDLDAQ
jgi:hypothetical protein